MAAGTKAATGSVAVAGPAMTMRVPSVVAAKPPPPAVMAAANTRAISVRVLTTIGPVP